MIQWIIFSVVIIIIIILYLLNLLFSVVISGDEYKKLYTKSIEEYKKKKFSKENPKIAIILTSTVNTKDSIIMSQRNSNERLNTYLKSFRQWIKEKDLYIIIVENSGYKFDELNINPQKQEIITFKESEIPEDKYFLENCQNKGTHESYSIQYAIQNSKLIKDFSDEDIIIKITGRYYIPNFYKILKQCISGLDQIIIQNKYHPIFSFLGIRCEVIGCRKYLSDFLFGYSNEEKRAAEIVYKCKIKKAEKICKLPGLKIEPTLCGGFTQAMYEL